jgi:preprotein translocase subunit SecD
MSRSPWLLAGALIALLAACSPSPCPLEFRLAEQMPVEGWQARRIEASDRTFHVAPESFLTARHVRSAQVVEGENGPAIEIELTEEGATLFAEFTAAHIGDRVAVILDGNLVSAPRIMAAMLGGRARISGDFTLEEAQVLAFRLEEAAEMHRAR